MDESATARFRGHSHMHKVYREVLKPSSVFPELHETTRQFH
jgi:hypothetical protein